MSVPACSSRYAEVSRFGTLGRTCSLESTTSMLQGWEGCRSLSVQSRRTKSLLSLKVSIVSDSAAVLKKTTFTEYKMDFPGELVF